MAYKNFAANKHISHIGLGVAGINTSKVLTANGITADVVPITDSKALGYYLYENPTVTHVVISAPWIPSKELQALTLKYPRTVFAVNCHSNVGFLQADANGVQLFAEGMEIERGSKNFYMAGNSRKFCDWATETFGVPCTYLPNLYYIDGNVPTHKPTFHGHLLRIGAFGATRALKNLMSAAGAALTISRELDVDLELHINSGRDEGGAGIIRAIKAMYASTRHAVVVEDGWSSWHNHRKVVARMDLLISCSYTESFNMVTADGIAEGVPSVVSDAIDWVPANWQAPADDVIAIAQVGRALLHDRRARRDGLAALQAHNHDGLQAWTEFSTRKS